MQPSTQVVDADRVVGRKDSEQPHADAFGSPTNQSPGMSSGTVQRTVQNMQQLAPHEVMAWQRSAGNHAVAEMLGRNGRTAPPSAQPAAVQRAAVQRNPVGPEGGALDGDVEGRLRQAQNAGSSLPNSVRNSLEPTLGADLGGVKVHTGSQAVQLTSEMGAKAFTHKNHIYYGAGHSPSDLKLTAHEAVHTIQQGAVQQTAQRQEEEGISKIGQPSISRVAAQIQRWPWSQKKHRQKNMSDEDVDEYTRGGGGTANRVDRVKYLRNIGKSKTKKGFFKPNEVINPGFKNERVKTEMGNRAVASSRLDKWLGTNVLADEVWAEHNGETGSVSAQVEGTPLFDNKFETKMGDDFDIDMVLDRSQYRQENGEWYQNSGQRFNYKDFSNPQTQKGLSDLQLLDAITGQADRHGGNIYIDDQSGTVKGIDQDISFGAGVTKVDELTGKYHGLPGQVDQKTAKRILKKKAKNLPKVLGSKYGGSLSDDEIKNAQARLREVKAHLKKLKKEGSLVKNWDDTTYLRSLNAQDRMDSWGNSMMEPSYTKRSVNQFVGAGDKSGGDGSDLIPQFMDNPLFEPHQEQNEQEDENL